MFETNSTYFFVVCFLFFETGSLYVTQADLELPTLLPMPPSLGVQAYATMHKHLKTLLQSLST